MNLTREINGILSLAFRDVVKLLRDKPRMLTTVIFPFLFISLLGGSFKSSFGDDADFDPLVFVFTGVFAQTLFSSAASGIISLIEDRENDFSQEIFISPISRYSIVFGKILGEATVALFQGIAMILFAFILRISISPIQMFGLLWVGMLASLFGAAFGMLIMPNLKSQRAASQIFPFVLFPQFFLAGVFTPLKEGSVIEMVSHLAPMRYAVDLLRSIFYRGMEESSEVVLSSTLINLGVMAFLFLLFMIIGTAIFVRNERNR